MRLVLSLASAYNRNKDSVHDAYGDRLHCARDIYENGRKYTGEIVCG